MLAKDIKLPSGVTLVTDPEALIVAVSLPAASVSAEGARLTQRGGLRGRRE